jgi:hypothetical protein
LHQSLLPLPVTPGASSWHAALRSFAALQDESGREAAEQSVPPYVRNSVPLIGRFIAHAFSTYSELNSNELDELEGQALKLGIGFVPEALSIRIAIAVERAHQVGLSNDEITPLAVSGKFEALYTELQLAYSAATALFDFRLSGLLSALLGRLLASDTGEVKWVKPIPFRGILASEVSGYVHVPNMGLLLAKDFLTRAEWQLDEGACASPFLKRVRRTTASVLKTLGSEISKHDSQ